MSKYRALFVDEGREHVSAMSSLLVKAESDDDPAACVKEIARHAHSIKGMAASMGYEPITTLAHRLEDVVAARRETPLARDTIDLLLEGVDALGSQVECIAAEQPLSEFHDLLRRLNEHAKAGGTPADKGGKAALPPPTAPSEDIKGLAELQVSLADTTRMPAVRALLVARTLARLTQIVHSEPSAEQIRQRDIPSLRLRFWIAEDADPVACTEALRGVPEVEDVQVAVAKLPSSPTDETGSPHAAKANAEHGVGLDVAGAARTVSTHTTVRVQTVLLDDLLDTVGELFIARQRLRTLVEGSLAPDARAAFDHLDTRVHEMHHQVMRMRMTPMKTLTDRYPRLVRDLSRALKKNVALVIKGDEIELDRAVLDNLDAPFVHTLRNALDHGIEPPAERVECGKPTTGTVEISASRDRDSVLVEIHDDGRGLNPDKLRTLALERGLLSPAQVENMSAREAYSLVCLPGFSTKGEVSDVSGRGVGMDVVRTKIESIGGSLDIDSEMGRGTRLTFRLPLTLAIIPVLLVGAANRVFAIPAANVVAIREPGEDVFEQAGGDIYLSFQHALVLITPLSVFLRLRRRARVRHVVLLEDSRNLHALAVDKVLGYQQVVVKPLGEPLDKLEWFAGATVLGDGQPALILDVPKALRMRSAA